MPTRIQGEKNIWPERSEERLSLVAASPGRRMVTDPKNRPQANVTQGY
jgi:hypothetical protein